MNMFMFFFILVYAVVMIAVTLKGRGITETRIGYFLGGQSLGLLVSITSLIMGFLSGMVIVGFPGFGLRMSGKFFMTNGFGYIGLVYPWIGYKLWKYGKKYNYISSADYMEERYESKGYGKLVAVIQLCFMIPYMTVQFVAFGNAMEYFAGISFMSAQVLFAAFIAIGLFTGGAKGVGTMDVINAALGLIIPLALCIVVIVNNGGFSVIGSNVDANDPNFLRSVVSGSFGKVVGTNLQTWFSGFFALLFGPHILSKMLMMPDKKRFQKMVTTVPISYAIICAPLQLLSTLGIAYYYHLLETGKTDNVLLYMLGDHASVFLIGLMMLCILAFSLSTANAFAVCISTIISHDFYDDYKKKQSMDINSPELVKRSIRVGKIGTLIVLIIVIIFANQRSVYITDYAYGLAGPGFAQIMPPLVFGLYWRRGNRKAAWASTITGLVVLFLTMFVWKHPLGILAIIWALLANTLIYLVVTFFTKPSRECYEKFFAEDDEVVHYNASVLHYNASKEVN